MLKKASVIFVLILSSYLTGCASVKMASPEQDLASKTFAAPSDGKAGVYIYRNSHFGAALKKTVYINGEVIGETAPMTYFHKEVAPGSLLLSTESEFSDNDLSLTTQSGKNYFIRQYIKLGAFVGGAGLEIVDEHTGQKGVLECKRAK